MLHPSEWSEYRLLIASDTGAFISYYQTQTEFFERVKEETGHFPRHIYSMITLSDETFELLSDDSKYIILD